MARPPPTFPLIDLLRNYFEITAEDAERKRREKESPAKCWRWIALWKTR
jgi:hypothetical protein